MLKRAILQRSYPRAAYFMIGALKLPYFVSSTDFGQSDPDGKIPRKRENFWILQTNNEPTVSVIVVTYNQRPFIQECLNGILCQQTSFRYEIIVGEDESSDGTREVCRQYAERYPEKIRLFLRNRKDVIFINGSATGRFNFLESLKAAGGKYIALCEGDDFWTDPFKLQKQVDFMENNPDFAICFHNTVKFNMTANSRQIMNEQDFPDVTTLEDLLRGRNYIPTCSVLYRRDCLTVPEWITVSPYADYVLHLTAAQKGKIKFMSEAMGCYRVHPGSIHGHTINEKHGSIKLYLRDYNFWKVVGKHMFNKNKLRAARVFILRTLISLAERDRKHWWFCKYNLLLLRHSGRAGIPEVLTNLKRHAKDSLRRIIRNHQAIGNLK